MSPLTDSETAQLIAGLLKQAVLPAEVHSALLERAGGNPLYAEEFVRMLSDRGFVQREGRVVSMDASAGTPMPHGVQALIAARLDTLPSERKTLLHNAAVIGKVFWSGAVASLGDIDEETVIGSLQELVRKELIRPARYSSVAGQHEYSFWHALIRDVAYGQIPRAVRAEKHCAVAGWIEATAGERATDVAEVLVHHLDEADTLLRASGHEARADQLAEPLIRHLVAAGQRAEDLDAARAERYFQRALGLLGEGSSQRALVLVGAGRSCQLAGNLEEAERYLREAIAEAEASNDVVTGADAMTRLSIVRWWKGGTGKGDSLLTDAIARLEGFPPSPALASAYTYSAEYALLNGRLSEGLEWAEKALAVADELNLKQWSVEARADRGDARCGLGDLGGLDDLRVAVSEGIDLGLGEASLVAASVLAEWQWIAEGTQQSKGSYEECLRFGERRGLVTQTSFAQAEILRVLCDSGEWESLLQEAGDVIAWGRDNPGQVETVALIPYAYVRLHRGQLNEAVSSRERLLPQAREIGDLQTLVPALVLAAAIDNAVGSHKSAVTLLKEWEALTDHSDPWRARYLPAAARVLAAHDPAEAESIIAGLNVTAARDSNCLLTSRAIVAEAKGDFGGARDLYYQAVARWERYGWVIEQAQAHLGEGRCFLALGARREATEPLQRARSIFSNLGAVPLLTETDGHLEESEAAS